MNEKHYLRYDS